MALENKLGITDSAELAREEERLSKKKALELYDAGILDHLEAGKFSTLAVIHKHLFGRGGSDRQSGKGEFPLCASDVSPRRPGTH